MEHSVIAMSLIRRGDIVSKHHKKREQEEKGNNNSLLGNIDINQVIQLLANMNRKPEPKNTGGGSGLGDGLGTLLQGLLSNMKKEENVIRPEEVIIEDEEPVEVFSEEPREDSKEEFAEAYNNEELKELIEQLKILIATLQNNIEHK